MPEGVEVVSGDHGLCATVVGDGKSYRLIHQSLSVRDFSAGSVWRLTARMRGVGVEKGDAAWKNACLRWVVSVNGQNRFETAGLVFGDSEWRAVSVDLTVPSAVSGIAVEAGLNGNAGRVWVDDIRVSEIKKPSP
jgi:hypothetical protein